MPPNARWLRIRLGFIPLNQRRQDIGIGIHARCNIRNRYACLGHRFGRSCCGDKARFALDQEVVGFLIGIVRVLLTAAAIA